MNLTHIALRRPVTVVMAFVSLAIIGLVSSRLLPLEKFPNIEIPAVFINVPYQGSTPSEVERLLTRPLEESIATLDGIDRLESRSTQNGAEITVFFGWGADVEVKGVEVQDRIDAVRDELPADVERIFVGKFSTSDMPILTLRLSSERDLSTSYDMLDRNLKRRIERLEGVSSVRMYGVDPQEIRIQLLADRVAAHGIDLNALVQTLRQSNFAVSAGQVTVQGERLRVRPVGEFRSLEEIAALPIGNGVRLGDVAEIAKVTPERDYGRHLDRRYAIGLDVFRETGANMVDVTERVLAEIDKINELPQMRGINIFFMDNQADNVQQSLSDLLMSGLIGACLSLLVLYLFLRQVSTTLMVTLAVPFSLLITLGAMYFLGISLNILSMMGLMLAVGMLVDNAVVVSESIFRRKEMQPDQPFEATLTGTREVAMAVTAGTLTTIIVFLPNLFGTQTEITVFLAHVSVTIVVSLLASLAVSQTIIPMLAARIRPPARKPEGDFISRLRGGYRRALDWSLQRRWITIGFILLILASVAIPAGLVKQDMFPQENTRRLFLSYHIDGNYPLEKVEEAVYRIENYLYGRQEDFQIRSVYSWFEPDNAVSIILLREEGDNLKSTESIKQAIMDGMPEIAVGAPSFDEQRVGAQQGLRVTLHGDSSEVLAGLSREVARSLETLPGIVSARSLAGAGEREVQILVDRERALRLGLDTQGVAMAVATAMRGQNLRPYRGGTGEIDMRLAFAEDDSQTLEQLRALPLFTPDGTRVRLESIAKFRVVPGPAAIRRENQRTSIGIEAALSEGATMNEVQPRIKRLMDSLDFPPGYGWTFGQSFSQAEETQNAMLVNMLLAIMLIYLVMAALFESVMHPAAIISSILFSVIGVFWFFLITDTTFSLMAMIGILILMGIVVNNGIVMVDHVNNLRREGLSRHEAILQGASDRLRPILMTVCTTILGLVPLAVGDTQIGGDGPPYFPMARAIIGGLAFSTVISLLVLPTIYLLLDDLAHWGRAMTRRAAGMRLLKPGEAASGG